jgi:SAM-dependent methyltransferase
VYRTKCGLCGTGDLNQFLDLGKTPLADRFPATRDEVEEFWPLRVAMCERCKLVQLMDIVPDDVLYGSDYAYYTGAASSHNPYWDQYATSLKARFPGGGKLLEIACNDGSLLTRLFDHGFDVVGIDPATGPLSQIHDSIPTHDASFGLNAAEKLVDLYGQFDIVVANNVIAHVSDLEDFVKGISRVTHRDSVIVIEVQYLGDLLTGNQFDHFYHEHRSFFSLRTLERKFTGLGFTIFDVQRTPAQGGSIRVFLSKGSNKYPIQSRVADMKVSEKWLDEWFTMESMEGRVQHIVTSLYDMVYEEITAGKLVAAYGATAKSCTLLNQISGMADLIDWVQDTTPWKQGRFTPGTKIQVLAPKDEPVRPDVYLLTAWNYAPAILRQEAKFMADGGRFLVPLPKPVIL